MPQETPDPVLVALLDFLSKQNFRIDKKRVRIELLVGDTRVSGFLISPEEWATSLYSYLSEQPDTQPEAVKKAIPVDDKAVHLERATIGLHGDTLDTVRILLDRVIGFSVTQAKAPDLNP